MNQSLVDLPAHERQRLCTALDNGLLRAPYTAVSLQSIGIAGHEDVLTALNELADVGVRDRGAAAWLRTIEHASTARPHLMLCGLALRSQASMPAIRDGYTKNCSVQRSVRFG